MTEADTPTPIRDVGDTAFMVAAWRAVESARPDALFRDPLAERLSGDKGKDIISRLSRSAFAAGWSVVIRTRVIDELILSALSQGFDTVLNLGAGLDTRPYRLDLPPGTRWIEVDMPKMIEFKSDRLSGEKPRVKLERIAADLSDPRQRGEVLARVAASSRKALVLTEGVILYLESDDVAALARELRAHPQFAAWIVDYFAPETYRYRRRSGMSRDLRNAPFRFEPEDFHEFFREQGWRQAKAAYLAEESEKLGRPFPLPRLVRLWMGLLSKLLPRERAARFKRFMGYVMLEPVRD